ncbi:hypothetical protein QZH41_007031 [Actinostola sp. cb2023]|nr:hypothetical protein QZH41_007031 [Actinostola sp. cb2023]
MTLSGKVSYKDFTNTARHLFISITLPIRDLLRPLAIDTEVFGNKWSETPFEKRQSITSKVTDAETFIAQVEEGLGLKNVEIIGKYMIIRTKSKGILTGA